MKIDIGKIPPTIEEIRCEKESLRKRMNHELYLMASAILIFVSLACMLIMSASDKMLFNFFVATLIGNALLFIKIWINEDSKHYATLAVLLGCFLYGPLCSIAVTTEDKFALLYALPLVASFLALSRHIYILRDTQPRLEGLAALPENLYQATEGICLRWPQCEAYRHSVVRSGRKLILAEYDEMKVKSGNVKINGAELLCTARD